MRVDQHVRLHSAFTERHVLLPVHDSVGSLLTMSTRELVTDFRYSDASEPDFRHFVAFLVNCEHHLVNDSLFGGF